MTASALSKADVDSLRASIPLLSGADAPAFLDNACMTLKPRPVIDAVVEYYEKFPVCAGRATYDLARELGTRVREAREDIAKLLGARDPDSLVFTKNATEAINLVTRAYHMQKGEVVLVTDREHNSNFVPWKEKERRIGVKVDVLPSSPAGAFDLAAFERRMAKGDVKFVAMAHASNLDGSSIPAKEVVEIAHRAGALVLLDGAQAAGHMPVGVHALGVDFYAASCHKMMGPTGVGVLYASPDAMPKLDRFLTGGDTVSEVTYESVTFRDGPARFEAGLQNYSGILGAGAAARLLRKLGPDRIHAHEVELNRAMTEGLSKVPGVRILGPQAPEDRGGICAFTFASLGPHEVAILLDDKFGVQVRSGDHCVHAWFNAKGIDGSVRASAYAYNTLEDARRLVEGVGSIASRLARA